MVSMNHHARRLQTQWATGMDLWRNVPLGHKWWKTTNSNNSNNGNTASMRHRVKDTLEECDDVQSSGSSPNHHHPSQHGDSTTTSSSSGGGGEGTHTICPWPLVVQQSVLYGFGAYNPRGRVESDAINRRQHALLASDLSQQRWPSNAAVTAVWEGASIWTDGSMEKGFIVAVTPAAASLGEEDDSNDTSTNNDDVSVAHEWIIELATKYDQGAVYRYRYVTEGSGQLIRETVPVLDPGTGAVVEMEWYGMLSSVEEQEYFGTQDEGKECLP